MKVYRSDLTEKEVGFIEWKMEHLLDRLGYEVEGKYKNNDKWINEFKKSERQWHKDRKRFGPEKIVDETVVKRKLYD